jgi:DNA-binding transcriptional ArsR family regulator
MRTTSGSGSLEGGLKALAEPTRFIILAMLSKYGRLNAGQMVSALGIPQAGVSQHLRVLRYQGVVEVDRSGQWAYYRLVPERIEGLVKSLHELVSGTFYVPTELATSIELQLKADPIISDVR